jgi:hypothetical protein
VFGAETGGAAIYQPGSYLFTGIAELKDDLSHSRVAGLAPLFHARASLGFPRSGRVLHSLLKALCQHNPRMSSVIITNSQNSTVTFDVLLCIT